MKPFTFAVALLAACATNEPLRLSAEPTLGALLPPSAAASTAFVVGGAQQSWTAYRVVFRDVEYIVGVDDARRIRYIETNDPAFRTREGLRVGATAGDVAAASGREPVYEAGWGRWTCVPSGWCAFFAAPSATDPAGPPRVLSFFRREGNPVDQRRIH
jgi:hypothetical protein